MRLVRFGDFTFEDYFTDFSANFADVSARAEALPGADGGYDIYGSGRAPAPVGVVKASLVLEASTRASMQSQNDNLRRLTSKGRRKLFAEPTDPSQPLRWADARVVKIDAPETYNTRPWVMQKAALTFQAADPRWYSQQGIEYLNTGLVLDGSWAVGGFNLGSITSGDVETLTNEGSAPTPLRLDFAVSTSLASIRVQHHDADGILRSDWTWAGALVADESLTVNSMTARVLHRSLVGTVSGYDDFTVNAGAAFILLEPGANTLTITGTFSGLTATAEYFDGWR